MQNINIEKDELTDQTFWDDYWKNCKIPNNVSNQNSFERCLSNEFKKKIKKNLNNKSILEIGCAPGKWLSFFHDTFGMNPFGIDYSQEGINATKRNFNALNIDSSGLFSKDFFSMNTDYLYDVVMSLGFIEHFENPDVVVKKHIDLLKPGGLLILGVPNFRGIYKPIQKMMSDRILKKHNLDIMKLKYFKRISDIFNLEILSSSYIGSFEPCLFIDENLNPRFYHKVINLTLKFCKHVRKLDIFDNINHPLISSYILSIYKKKNG